MMDFLLNYATLAVVVFLLIGLVTLLVTKCKKLTKTQKAIIYVVCAVLIAYLFFVGLISFSFGNTHPAGGPKPSF